jgi:hypothetical protein
LKLIEVDDYVLVVTYCVARMQCDMGTPIPKLSAL